MKVVTCLILSFTCFLSVASSKSDISLVFTESTSFTIKIGKDELKFKKTISVKNQHAQSGFSLSTPDGIIEYTFGEGREIRLLDYENNESVKLTELDYHLLNRKSRFDRVKFLTEISLSLHSAYENSNFQQSRWTDQIYAHFNKLCVTDTAQHDEQEIEVNHKCAAFALSLLMHDQAINSSYHSAINSIKALMLLLVSSHS